MLSFEELMIPNFDSFQSFIYITSEVKSKQS
jgi:hypothetical protein